MSSHLFGQNGASFEDDKEEDLPYRSKSPRGGSTVAFQNQEEGILNIGSNVDNKENKNAQKRQYALQLAADIRSKEFAKQQQRMIEISPPEYDTPRDSALSQIGEFESQNSQRDVRKSRQEHYAAQLRDQIYSNDLLKGLTTGDEHIGGGNAQRIRQRQLRLLEEEAANDGYVFSIGGEPRRGAAPAQPHQQPKAGRTSLPARVKFNTGDDDAYGASPTGGGDLFAGLGRSEEEAAARRSRQKEYLRDLQIDLQTKTRAQYDAQRREDDPANYGGGLQFGATTEAESSAYSRRVKQQEYRRQLDAQSTVSASVMDTGLGSARRQPPSFQDQQPWSGSAADPEEAKRLARQRQNDYRSQLHQDLLLKPTHEFAPAQQVARQRRQSPLRAELGYGDTRDGFGNTGHGQGGLYGNASQMPQRPLVAPSTKNNVNLTANTRKNIFGGLDDDEEALAGRSRRVSTHGGHKSSIHFG